MPLGATGPIAITWPWAFAAQACRAENSIGDAFFGSAEVDVDRRDALICRCPNCLESDMISLVWRSSSETVPLEEFWPLDGIEGAEAYRRGEDGPGGKALKHSGILVRVPVIPEDSWEAVESAMLNFVSERREAISALEQTPGVRSEFDLLVSVGSSDAFGRIITFSPDLLRELCRHNIFLTVSCVPASDA